MHKHITLIALLFLSQEAWANDDEYSKLIDGLPTDAVEIIERIVGCNHWAGEEAYDEERRKEIMNAVTELRCEDVNSDTDKISEKYSSNNRVVEAISTARGLVY
jgi:hypothetical protein